MDLIRIKRFSRNKLIQKAKLYNGRLQLSTGSLVLDVPTIIDKDIECMVDTKKLLSALTIAGDEANIRLAKTLIIKNKQFRAMLQYTELQDAVEPLGVFQKCEPAQLFHLKKIFPFIGTDASRSWATCIHLKDNLAYATNNVVFVRTPFEWHTEISIPQLLLDNLFQQDKELIALQGDDTSITFHFEDSSWLSGQLNVMPWPDVSALVQETEGIAIPEKMPDVVSQLVEFVEDRDTAKIFFGSYGVWVQEGESNAEHTEFSFPSSIMKSSMINLVFQYANKIDFTTYPKPCYFSGDDIDGVIVGVRK